MNERKAKQKKKDEIQFSFHVFFKANDFFANEFITDFTPVILTITHFNFSTDLVHLRL